MPYYIKYGLKAPWLAAVVATVTVIGYGFVFPGIQANNIASSVEQAFNLTPWITAVVITSLLAIVIVGGTKRIVSVASTIVPIMAVGYMLTALIVICFNLPRVPETIVMIVQSGVGIEPMFGGLLGYAVAWGVRRAVFASATGLGEGTFAAAAADTTHPGKQGIVQAFSIYIDILLVCMSTGLIITVTNSYHVLDKAGGFLVNHVPGAVAGPNFVQLGIDQTLPGWGSIFVAIAVFLFAFTSQVFFFYVATTNLVFLLGERRNRLLESLLKVGALSISFIGCVVQAEAMWAVGDIGYGIIGWLNMASVLLLTPIIRKIVRDYDRQRKLGLDPTFDPLALDIQGADYWVEKNRVAAGKAVVIPGGNNTR